MPVAPAETDALPAAPAHRHAHEHGHVHSHAPAHPHHHHAPGHRHPAARPGFSLMLLSAWQRLALVLPLAVLIWAAALAVIWYGAA